MIGAKFADSTEANRAYIAMAVKVEFFNPLTKDLMALLVIGNRALGTCKLKPHENSKLSVHKTDHWEEDFKSFQQIHLA